MSVRRATGRRGRREREDYFPLLSLAPEVLSCILNKFNQTQVLELRLLSKRMRNLVDELYAFKFSIYDEPDRLAMIRKLKCEKITVWKLTLPMENHLLDCPGFLKTMEINGPVTESNLQSLIEPCVNLERLSVIRRANYPWILTLRATPTLANLKKLKSLFLNCEETKACGTGHTLPLMDCYFPSLKIFEIVKGFHISQYSSYLEAVLGFVSRHHRSLQVFKLCMLARTNLCLYPPEDDPEPAMEVDGEEQEPGQEGQQQQQPRPLPPPQPVQPQGNRNFCPEELKLEDLCRVRLQRLGLTTQGYEGDIKMWSAFLATQSELEEFRFDWSRVESGTDPLYSGFPWPYFEAPILQSCANLVSVELNNIAVVSVGVTGARRLNPINLAVFGCCSRLEYLTLANTEGTTPPSQPSDFSFLEEGQSVCINGLDLPPSLLSLRIEGLPIQSTDLVGIINKCDKLQSITFKDLGEIYELGVTADVIRAMVPLPNLKYLQLVNFNISTPEKLMQVQAVFDFLDIPYEGRDTWLRLWNGPIPAHQIMKRLIPEPKR